MYFFITWIGLRLLEITRINDLLITDIIIINGLLIADVFFNGYDFHWSV